MKTGSRFQVVGFRKKIQACRISLAPDSRAFTLIETMVAISLLVIAIIPPMLLTVQSLASAYYSRDQITAFYLAQEGIEEVHQIRDGQILQIAESGSGSSIDIFGPIPKDVDFRIDARQSNPSDAITQCSGDPNGICIPLETDGSLYGYDLPTPTNFTRTLLACYVQPGGDCNSNETDEMRITSTVSWQTGSYERRTFSISEDLYRWVCNGSAGSGSGLSACGS